jgi:hypothetical protein
MGLIRSGFELNNDKDILILSWDTKDVNVSEKMNMKFNYWRMWWGTKCMFCRYLELGAPT